MWSLKLNEPHFCVQCDCWCSESAQHNVCKPLRLMSSGTLTVPANMTGELIVRECLRTRVRPRCVFCKYMSCLTYSQERRMFDNFKLCYSNSFEHNLCIFKSFASVKISLTLAIFQAGNLECIQKQQ